MPTARELRAEVQAVLELATAAKEYYARVALMELARNLSREARQAELREREMAARFDPSAHPGVALPPSR
jgi:hypothetical protein